MNWYLPNLRRCFNCSCTNQPNRQPHVPAPDGPAADISASDIIIPDVPTPDIPAHYAESPPHIRSAETAESPTHIRSAETAESPTHRPDRPSKICSRRYRPAQTYLHKSDTQSSVIIPDSTVSQTSYPLAVLTLDNANRKICQAYFTFSCNIRLEQAVLFLNFRITQQGREDYAPVPLQSNWNYSRQNISSMTDAVSFSTCCCDLIPDENNTICFWADLIGVSQGAAYITNSILTALIQTYT